MNYGLGSEQILISVTDGSSFSLLGSYRRDVNRKLFTNRLVYAATDALKSRWGFKSRYTSPTDCVPVRDFSGGLKYSNPPDMKHRDTNATEVKLLCTIDNPAQSWF